MKSTKTKICCNFCIPLLLGMLTLFPLLTDLVFSQYPHCRTPSAKKTVIFEPAEFHLSVNFGGAKAVSDTQGYKPLTNPTPDYDI